MKLYTKSGDDGTTGLADGSRVRKIDLRVAAYGDLDETNAAIGMARAVCDHDELHEQLGRVQSHLFTIGAELAGTRETSGMTFIDDTTISQLEAWIDQAADETTPLKNFVLPGGTPLAVALHMARCICRRAERTVVSATVPCDVRPEILRYVNRLSDYLFAAARLSNHRSGHRETTWPVGS